MTQTLTTDELRQIVASAKTSLEQYLALELLANLEAKPVGYVSASTLNCLKSMQTHEIITAKPEKDAVNERDWDVIPVYTAPPAPAAQKCECTSIDYCDSCMRAMSAVLAPAVPDERAEFESFIDKRFGELVDRRRAKNGDNEYMAWDMAVAWIVWQRRAAMLDGSGVLWSGFDPAKGSSDAIPDGWKLVPAELTKEMQDAWDSAPVSSDDYTVNMMNAYRAMIAAAPEGGNG